MEDHASKVEEEKAVEAEKAVDVAKAPEKDAKAAESQAEKPKKKTGLIAAIAVGAVLLVAGSVFAFVKLTEKEPKEVVITAFENVYADDQVNPIEELFGLSQFAESAAAADVETELTIRLDDSSEESIQAYSGSGLRVTGQYDRTKKKSGANAGVMYKGMDLFQVQVYYGEENLMAALPEFTSRVFMLDLSDGLGERIEKSPILGPMLKSQGVNVEGLAAYFEEAAAQVEAGKTQKLDIDGLMKRYQEGTKAQENFKAAMTVEKAEKGTFVMNGEEVNCKGYLVLISKDSMMNFLRTSTDFFLNDEELKDLYLEQLQQSVRITEMMGGGYSGVSAEELYASTMEDVADAAEEMINFLDESLNDVTMTVYVDKKGNLAAVNGSTHLTVEEEDIQVLFDVLLEGGAYPTQNLKAKLEMEKKEESEKVTVNLTRQGTYDGTNLTDDISIDLKLEDEETHTFGLTYTDTYQADSGDFHVGASVTADSYLAADVSMTGIVNQLEKGKSIQMDIDELKVMVMGKTASVTLSGEYYYGPLSEEVVKPEGQIFDIVAANEEEWQSVAMEIIFQAMELTGQLEIE